MRLILLCTIVTTTALLLAGCTFAHYSKVHVQVVDAQTQTGIPKARVRTFYLKPMLDMTYQHKSRKKTDHAGFATLTVATNSSQRMMLGWTYGIFPYLYVRAIGYRPREVGIPEDAFGRAHPLLIQLEKTNAPAVLPATPFEIPAGQ